MFTERITNRRIYRPQLSDAIKDIISLLAYNYTVTELVVLACSGDLDSLIKLIKLDKVFLTAKFAQEWVKAAQSGEHKIIFKLLSNALLHDTYREYISRANIGIACYMLWFLGFKNLPRKELLDFIEKENIANYPDPSTFYRMLNRIGLRKYKRSKCKSRTIIR